MRNEHYYQEVSPYKMIFGVIEDAAQIADISPSYAYGIYDMMVGDRLLDPTVYLSMAITSAGFKRDPDLSFGEVLDKNTRYGSLAALAIIERYSNLDITDIIVPSELGKVRGWSQADYLLFWFHVISGVDYDAAVSIESSLRLSGLPSTPGFSDPSLTSAQRWGDYASLATKYADLFKNYYHVTPPSNIRAILFVLDKELSLGARAEDLLCRKIGIPPQNVTLTSDELERARPVFKGLVKDLSIIGATALGTHTRTGSPGAFSQSPLIDYDPGHLERLRMRPTGMFSAIEASYRYGRHRHQPTPAPESTAQQLILL